MELGAFSISLPVKNLAASRTFYEKLGFQKVGGEGKYAIMKNGDAIIGLFEGMFDTHILTFNPGWDQSQKTLDDFTDVRKIREALAAAGVEVPPAGDDEPEVGPAHFVLKDPDGNTILIDQHV